MSENKEKNAKEEKSKERKKTTQTTRKATRILGLQSYLNTNTGEYEDFHVISVEERDANFHKIWLQHIISSLDMIGNKKMKFAFWLMDQMTADNLIPMTYRQMVAKSGYSMDIAKAVIPALIKSNFLVRINQGCYQINPEVIFKGGNHHRMNVLYEYTNSKPPPVEDEEEREKLSRESAEKTEEAIKLTGKRWRKAKEQAKEEE